MRKISIIASLCLSLVMQLQLSYSYAQSSSKTLDGLGQAWLDQHKDPPQVNVYGDWNTELGEIHLNQEDSAHEIKGMGNGYVIRGVVSGSTVYLLFLEGKKNWVEYCAVLTIEKNQSFYGTYYDRVSRHNHHELCSTTGTPMSMTKK